DLARRAILAPTNVQVHHINESILAKLAGDQRCFRSTDRISRDGALHQDFLDESALHTENPAGYPPHELNLKPGAVVMLLRNISIPTGLTNGTRLIVEEMRGNF